MLLRLTAICLLTVAPAAAAAERTTIATEVYRLDFESGLQGIAIINPAVTLTENPAEVLEGTRSLKLDGPGAAIALHPGVVPLQPSKIYAVEYRYRALSSAFAWALGVGFQMTGANGVQTYLPLRGPVAPAGSVGVDARSARAGGPQDTFVFHTWGGAAIIDEIRIVRYDVLVGAAQPPLVTAGFPRLGNYALLTPDLVALINHANQDEVEDVAARYDLMTGTSFDHTVGAGAWVRRLTAKNPLLRLLPYKQAFMAQFEGGADASGLTELFNSGLDPTWFMLTPAGGVVSEPAFPQNVQLNHTPFGPVVHGRDVNSYTADFLADHVLTSGLWSGIHFDQPEWYINPLLGDPPPPLDLDRDGHAEPAAAVQHAWALGFFDYFSKMARRLGAGTLLYGNAGHIPGNPNVLPMLNGWQGEVISPYPIAAGGDWITDAPSQWYRLLNNYRMATTYARAPQVVSLEFTGRELGTQTGELTPNGYPQRTRDLEPRDYRRMRLGLTTALLSNGFFEYDLVDNTTVPLWFDEFAVDAGGNATTSLAGKGYLGQPLGPATELPYAARLVFNLDFESPAPSGVLIGPGMLTTNPAEVISGSASFVLRQNDLGEGKWLFQAANLLQPGMTYQLFADYRILDYRPTSFAGLLGIGFRDEFGGMPPERSASLYLPDSAGPGQQGTLRAAIKASRSDTAILGGLTDTGAVAFDNIRLVEGTGGVWRRDFENGIVLVNPTPAPLFVSQAEIAGPRSRRDVRRIAGTQAPAWNDGSAVTSGVWLPAGDGIILLAARHAAPTVAGVGAITVVPGTDVMTLVWPAMPEPVAGYLIRYGETSDNLTRSAAAGPMAWITLTELAPGQTYVARVTAHDFLGHEGPAVDVTFTAPGTALDRPAFTLSSPALAPGSIATVDGSQISNVQLTANTSTLPLSLGGTAVLVNGVAAPIVSVSPNRAAFVVPWEITGSEAVLVVIHNGVASAERRVPIAKARPWIATWPDGGLAVATHQDGSLISNDAAARQGEPIDILAAGLGAVAPLPDNGVPAGGPHPALATANIEVRVGGLSAAVTGAWLVPGSIATYGIRITIPGGVASGFQPIEVTVGGEPANTTWIPVEAGAQ